MVWQIDTRSNDSERTRGVKKEEEKEEEGHCQKACQSLWWNCVDSSTPRSATISWACSLGLSQQDPSWSRVRLQVSKWSQTMRHLCLSHKLTKKQTKKNPECDASTCRFCLEKKKRTTRISNNVQTQFLNLRLVINDRQQIYTFLGSFPQNPFSRLSVNSSR